MKNCVTKCLTFTLALFSLYSLISCDLLAYPVPKRAFMYDNSNSEKKLTLLVYMAADNDLESYGIQNLKAMERADFSSLNVLVLFDRAEHYDETNGNWTDTRLFEVTHDATNGGTIVSKRLDCPPLGLSATTQTELDMANYNVLKSFIEFAKENYKSQYYSLIIWGHGTGWRYKSRAVAVDDKTNSYMCIKDLGLALKNQELCVIGFDTCFGSIFENLYELKDCTEYIAASPGLTPAAGWNYKKLLQELNNCDFSPQTISAIMAKNTGAQTTVTETLQIPLMMQALENFSEQLANTIIDNNTRIDTINTLMESDSYSYIQYPCDLYLDINSMAAQFCTDANQELVQAAEQLKALEATKGIGIYFMPVIAQGVFASSHSINYIKDNLNTTQCSFIKDSNWWVPSKNTSSGSLLNKLFYTTF
ncbi:MAG: hypothetical protein J6T20_06155 [Treponema sp.]|nr:hypothetical protein [Treponema sp.]